MLANLKLGLREKIEIVHFFDGVKKVYSVHKKIFIEEDGRAPLVIVLPFTKFDIFGWSRLLRRLFRLDKCNVFPIGPTGAFLIVRRGAVYRWDKEGALKLVLTLRQSRNFMHTDLCIGHREALFIGEYGANTGLKPVPIYRSDDQGRTWSIVYEIPAGRARHVHSINYDEFSGNIWVLTGDSDGECWIIEANDTFTQVTYHGDGSQCYRACTIFFEEKKVVWGMDSPISPSCVVHFDRATKEIKRFGSFPGPIWYSKRLPETGYLVCTTVEPGDAVVGTKAVIFFSTDLETWAPIHSFDKDLLPCKLFKFGVIGISSSICPSGTFYLFGEALKGLDGVSIKCQVEVIVPAT